MLEGMSSMEPTLEVVYGYPSMSGPDVKYLNSL